MKAFAALLLVLLASTSAVLAVSAASDDAAKVKKLQALQRSGGGVIDLDVKTFSDLVVGKSRPFSLIVVADAKDLRSQGSLKLGQLVSEFKLVAKAFAANHAGKPSAASVVFARMEFSRAKELFGRMGIQSLPYMARIPPSLAVSESGAVVLGKDEVMSTASYPWSAEDIAAWVGEHCGVAVGEIKRTAVISTRMMPLVSLAVLGVLGFVAYRLYYAPFMRHQWLYAVGALVIYWFSVSGGMFNIIRGVPLVGYDHRKRESIIFMPGQGQLGAEGFIMGTLYTAVGLAVAALVLLAPKVKDPSAQRVVAYAILLVACFAFNLINSNHHWKTGVSTEWYLF